jgi:uncharacterized protein DUF6884
MTQADRIRQFALDRYLVPARTRNAADVVIRAGDVHREMALSSAMPAVCSAIGSRKFEEVSGATIVKRTGPTNGANVYFHFSLTVGLQPARPPSLVSTFGERSTPTDAVDLTHSITLVSCVQSKLLYPAPARSLYTSAWFRKARDLVEASGARWFVLSSRYGLVAPETEIAPYDYTLNTLGVAERRLWAAKVLDKLVPEIRDERRVVMLAGARYRKFLIEPLEHQGMKVVVPMEHLRRGEQLGWLTERE